MFTALVGVIGTWWWFVIGTVRWSGGGIVRGYVSGIMGRFVIGTATGIVEDKVTDGTLWIEGWLCWTKKCRSNGDSLWRWGDEDAAEIIVVIEVWNGKVNSSNFTCLEM